MAYIAPIHRPSSVKHATLCRLFDPDEEHLIVAKTNRLEIYNHNEDGLILIHAKSLYGTITMLQRLQVQDPGLEQLFIGTDLQMYFVVSWDPSSQELQTERSYQDLADKTLRDSASQDRCLLDPGRRYLTLDLYKGIVSVVPLIQNIKRKGVSANGVLGEPVPARIPELEVRHSVFLSDRKRDARTKGNPRMAFLHENVSQQVKLSVRELDYTLGVKEDPGNAELDTLVWTYEDLEPGSNHLLAVPAPTCGVIVLSNTSITYIDDTGDSVIQQNLVIPTIFKASEQIDSQRWILADDYSHLYLLMLMLDERGNVDHPRLDQLGETSEASVLVYLGDGLVYVGSHFGASQLIRISERSLEVLQTFPNIAPVLDFSIMDMGSQSAQVNDYSSGKARLVSGSGGFQDGSLCSIRSGVGLEEQGILGEMDNISDIYAHRSPDSSKEDTLIVSFIRETRVFQFSEEGEVDEKASFGGLSLSSPTLLIHAMSSQKLLQVTDTCVYIVDVADDMVIHEWTSRSGSNITAASANDRFLALCVGGTELLVFDLESFRSLEPLTTNSFPEMGQVSCLHLPKDSGAQDVCFAGFWQNTTIAVLEVATLNIIKQISATDEKVSVPRSILLLPMIPSQFPTLLVALANGEVVTFEYDSSTHDARSRSATVLGTEQATLKALPRANGIYSCFATCEHPSLIYGSEKRLVFSAVTAEKATSVCPFDSAAYPNAVAIATTKDLRIGVVDNERATHVTSLPIGEVVRRVAYAPSIQAFGLGTIKRIVEECQEVNLSSFKLCDEIAFKQLDDYPVEENELIESVLFCTLRSTDGNRSNNVECFAVGTASLATDHSDDIRGRILLFAVTNDRAIELITEHPVKGACRALAEIDGSLVAGLAKTIVIYGLSASSLEKRCAYRTATAPVAISIASPSHDQSSSSTTSSITIAVADLMKSVSLLSYTRGRDGLKDELTEFARHYSTVWSTALTHISGTDDYLLSDDQSNLLVLHQNKQGVTKSDQRRLEITSELHLGELVNKIQPIPASITSSSAVSPKAFLATRDGGVYLVGVIQPMYRDLLMRLQAVLAEMIKGLGNVEFHRWRAFRTLVREAEEPYRFVDGEFLEGFLGLGEGEKEEVIKGMGTQGLGVGDVVGVVEGLRRLR